MAENVMDAPMIRLTTKGRELIGLLRTQPGQPVSRETLCKELWPRSKLRTADANLTTLVTMIREEYRIVGAGIAPIYTVHGTGYAWVEAPA